MSQAKASPVGPDLDTEAACRLLRHPPVSKETIYRLGKRGEIESYLVAGCRVWSSVSVSTLDRTPAGAWRSVRS